MDIGLILISTDIIASFIDMVGSLEYSKSSSDNCINKIYTDIKIITLINE